MLKWVRMWLDQDSQWLTPAQRPGAVDAAHADAKSGAPASMGRQPLNAYGYGWRISDVDGVLRVAHTGTPSGAYSAVTLLPEKKSGFVFMINGEGSEARIVLNEVLVKLHGPGERRRVADYARSWRESAAGPQESKPPALARQRPAATARRQLGIYRDPWFGEVAICERDGAIDFTSAKSPRLSGEVMQAGERLLVDWRDDSIDAEAWLDFRRPEPCGSARSIPRRISAMTMKISYSRAWATVR